ncbi:MAG: hypothetical protein ABR987_03440 [Terracidiphilus sp.]|jgi:hypothetical protein
MAENRAKNKPIKRDNIATEDYVPSAVPAVHGFPLTPILKSVTYFVAAVALLGLLLHVWDSSHEHPALWMKVFKYGSGAFFAIFTLLLGETFRRVLRQDLAKGLLSARTYEICDYWIASLLLFVYMGMLLAL